MIACSASGLCAHKYYITNRTGRQVNVAKKWGSRCGMAHLMRQKIVGKCMLPINDMGPAPLAHANPFGAVLCILCETSKNRRKLVQNSNGKSGDKLARELVWTFV